MKIGLRSLVFALTVLSATASYAQVAQLLATAAAQKVAQKFTLSAGSYRGTSSLIKSSRIADNDDVMALVLQKDPTNPNDYYAVLAEYDRVPVISLVEKLALTKWINRAYIYHVVKLSDLQYAMIPIRSNNEGQIVAHPNTVNDLLVLKKAGEMEGATIIRNNRFTEKAEETITLTSHVTSTWEDYVAGQFFASHDVTGGDYKKKTVNTELYANGTAYFFQPDIKGLFSIDEAGPRMFTFKEITPNNLGREKILGRIAVFIDIVNWKSFGIEKFTTEEMLIINPDDAKDLGFYYERH